MSCPICGRIYCDHGADERGQSVEEMMSDCLTPVNNKEQDKKPEDQSEETKSEEEK